MMREWNKWVSNFRGIEDVGCVVVVGGWSNVKKVEEGSCSRWDIGRKSKCGSELFMYCEKVELVLKVVS